MGRRKYMLIQYNCNYFLVPWQIKRYYLLIITTADNIYHGERLNQENPAFVLTNFKL